MSDSPKPPAPRFRLELVIDGNTLDEVVHELEVQTNDFAYEALRPGPAPREQFGGRHHLKLDERNPGMTPERYDAELDAWSEARREARA